jgi:hypothetical protein
MQQNMREHFAVSVFVLYPFACAVADGDIEAFFIKSAQQFFKLFRGGLCKLAALSEIETRPEIEARRILAVQPLVIFGFSY